MENKTCDLCNQPIEVPEGRLWFYQLSERGAGLAAMYVPVCREVHRLCPSCNSFVVDTFENLTREYFDKATAKFSELVNRRYNESSNTKPVA